MYRSINTSCSKFSYTLIDMSKNRFKHKRALVLLSRLQRNVLTYNGCFSSSTCSFHHSQTQKLQEMHWASYRQTDDRQYFTLLSSSSNKLCINQENLFNSLRWRRSTGRTSTTKNASDFKFPQTFKHLCSSTYERKFAQLTKMGNMLTFLSWEAYGTSFVHLSDLSGQQLLRTMKVDK